MKIAEKVTVKIGRITTQSARSDDFNRTVSQDINWLRKTFEISYARADKLLRDMGGDNALNTATSCHIVVDLDYRQLARYVAKRQVDDLNKYWKYPHVIAHVESDCVPDEHDPIELRPGIRNN